METKKEPESLKEIMAQAPIVIMTMKSKLDYVYGFLDGLSINEDIPPKTRERIKVVMQTIIEEIKP